MPGLVGYIGNARPTDARMTVETMVRAITHEDFYRTGNYADDAAGLYLGWAVHGPRNVELPIKDESDTLRLFLSREIVTDSGDMRGTLQAYRDRGTSFLEAFNDSFALVLHDVPRRRVILANDRYGLSRLYSARSDDGIYFASEAKALIAVLPGCRAFDAEGLIQFITYGATFGPTSLFEGVEVLPAGSLWEFEAGNLRTQARYFSFSDWETQEPLDRAAFLDEFVEEFGAAARLHAYPPGDVALSLTGGFDARTVLAASGAAPGALPCYTFAGLERESYDVKVARQLASVAAQPFTTLRLEGELIRQLPEYVERSVHLSDGYLGVSGAAELRVNELARDVAPLRLTGNYGSELLRGVRTLKPDTYDGVLVDEAALRARRLIEEVEARSSRLHPLTFVTTIHTADQGYGRRAIEESQVTTRSPFLDNRLVKLLYRMPSELDGAAVIDRVLNRYAPGLGAVISDRGYRVRGGVLHRTPQSWVREAVFKAEHGMRIGLPEGAPRVARVLAGRRTLESALLGRHKFYHPRPWLRDYLGEFTQDNIRGVIRSGVPGLLDASKINTTLESQFTHRYNRTQEVERLLCIALARLGTPQGGAVHRSQPMEVRG